VGELVNDAQSFYNVRTVERPNIAHDLDAIIAKYRPIVSFRVKKSLGSYTPDWEDVVNEIMLNTIEKLESGKFRGDSSVGTFIYTITSRRIIDHIRKKSKSLSTQLPAAGSSTTSARKVNRSSMHRNPILSRSHKNMWRIRSGRR